MLLQDKLNQDLKESMKSGNAEKTGLLRMLSAAIHNKQIEKGKDKELTDDDVLQVLTREAKKRKEAIELFEKGGRPELAGKERTELVLIEAYLPKQMAREEVEAAVEKVIVTLRGIRLSSAEVQAQGDVIFNNVMKAVMQELKGKADGKMISEIVKEKLS